MANSILGAGNKNANTSTINPTMLQQLSDFKRTYTGDPKRAVMQMLQQGSITYPQLQQAMQIAKQIQYMIK